MKARIRLVTACAAILFLICAILGFIRFPDFAPSKPDRQPISLINGCYRNPSNGDVIRLTDGKLTGPNALSLNLRDLERTKQSYSAYSDIHFDVIDGRLVNAALTDGPGRDRYVSIRNAGTKFAVVGMLGTAGERAEFKVIKCG